MVSGGEPVGEDVPGEGVIAAGVPDGFTWACATVNGSTIHADNTNIVQRSLTVTAPVPARRRGTVTYRAEGRNEAQHRRSAIFSFVRN